MHALIEPLLDLRHFGLRAVHGSDTASGEHLEALGERDQRTWITERGNLTRHG